MKITNHDSRLKEFVKALEQLHVISCQVSTVKRVPENQPISVVSLSEHRKVDQFDRIYAGFSSTSQLFGEFYTWKDYYKSKETEKDIYKRGKSDYIYGIWL